MYAFLVTYATILFVILVLGLAGWIFNSIQLYSLLRELGHPSPWMAWVPFGRIPDLGMIQAVNSVTEFNVDISVVNVLGYCTLISCASVIPIIGLLAGIVGFVLNIVMIVFTVMTINNFASYYGRQPVAPILCYLLVPFAGRGIMCMILRKYIDTEVM